MEKLKKFSRQEAWLQLFGAALCRVEPSDEHLDDGSLVKIKAILADRALEELESRRHRLDEDEFVFETAEETYRRHKTPIEEAYQRLKTHLQTLKTPHDRAGWIAALLLNDKIDEDIACDLAGDFDLDPDVILEIVDRERKKSNGPEDHEGEPPTSEQERRESDLAARDRTHRS